MLMCFPSFSDYRGLKKCITAIRRAKDTDGAPASPRLSLERITTHTSKDGELQPNPSASSSTPYAQHDHQSSSDDEIGFAQSSAAVRTPPPVANRGRPREPYGDEHEVDVDWNETRDSPSPVHTSQYRVGHASNRNIADDRSPSPAPSRRSIRIAETERPTRPIIQHAATLNMGMLPKFRKRSLSASTSLRKNTKGLWEVTRGFTGGWDLNKSIPIKDLIPRLTPLQKAFFDKLDAELEKVEVFYMEREKEMKAK